MDKIFVICNKNIEIERYENLQKIFDQSNIDEKDIELNCKCWSNDIEHIKKNNNNQIIYDNNLFINLNNSEISLFINHIEILKKIKKDYNKGIFLILESDIIVYPGMEFNIKRFKEIIDMTNTIDNWDIINIGGSCYDVFVNEGYPKTKPIIINNSKFYNEKRLICIEALLWNYNSICKFLDLFETYNKNKLNTISDPIDSILDNLCSENKLDLYWLFPFSCKQGSNIQYKSWLR